MNKHMVIIEGRNKIRISAVKNTQRFSDNEVLVYTECGDLLIKGCGLEVECCSEISGEIEIGGHINSAAYLSENCHVPDNFLSRLFR